MISNAVPPSVTPPSPDEWPQNLVKTITNITQDSRAKITSTAHGFTSADLFITQVMFQQVVGMLPINGRAGLIVEIVDSNNYRVNIDSTNFPIYRSAGITTTLTGEPPVQQSGFQFFNTPFQNIATTN